MGGERLMKDTDRNDLASYIFMGALLLFALLI
jgi:hypothetical protein